MTGCPPKAILRAFEQGELTDSAAPSIERHIAQCHGCRLAMDELRRADSRAREFRTVFREVALLEPGELPAVSAPGNDGVAASAANSIEHRVSSQTLSESWPIPDYERIILCGEGSYGSVWAVRDCVGVYRALKLIDVDRLKRAKAKCYEMNALQNYCRHVSRHPYLITVSHVGLVDHFLYYTMELADDLSGARPTAESLLRGYSPLTLESIIRARRLQSDVAVELVRRLLRGLSKLHDLNLIHRDIKPSNVVFVNRYPKLADIGVLTEAGSSLKSIGTPRYMPPDRALDRSADVYSMGRMLHEMLAGRDASTCPHLPESILTSGQKWNLRRVEQVIVRACSPEAKDRYPSAAAMLEELEAAAEPAFGSLFEELAAGMPAVQPPLRPQPVVQIVLALIDRLPWIAATIVLLYAIERVIR